MTSRSVTLGQMRRTLEREAERPCQSTTMILTGLIAKAERTGDEPVNRDKKESEWQFVVPSGKMGDWIARWVHERGKG
jgi:hypothetical protein